jgi:hypothetical protein
MIDATLSSCAESVWGLLACRHVGRALGWAVAACLGHDRNADHDISVLSCVLALTLLMLSWLLAPPGECRQAFLFAARRLGDVIPANKPRVSRSLEGLLVCRT